jgi:hypothetical protein
MKNAEPGEALHIIENMIRRRLKAQNKEADEAWIKSKALDIYDDSKENGDYIQELESDTELQ